MRYKNFIFKKYELNKQEGKINFFYSLDNKLDFVESLVFATGNIEWSRIDDKILNKAIFNLHLILGVSYYKTYCPPQITIKSGSLNKPQAQFWNKIYTNGLGEFFYRNKIDFRNLIIFPNENKRSEPRSMKLKNRSLVTIGGGKDSIVAAELLKEKKFDFSLISLRDSSIQRAVSKAVGADRILIGREMDNKLDGLNKAGAYNGHIPISVIYSFTCLLAAILYDYKYIIFANERSANYGNVRYLGKMINHQYSKSFEFEKDLSDYIHKYITPSIDSFSLLRPLSELKIVQLFSSYKQYFPIFSSCNRNFKITGAQDRRWCGECPKCAFVFTQLAAFLSKKEMLKIFGKNLYDDKNLLNLYLELLGLKNIKPFECVGTPEEVKAAMYLAWQTGEYDNDEIMKYFVINVLPKMKNKEKLLNDLLIKCGEDNIPDKFRIIKKYVCRKEK